MAQNSYIKRLCHGLLTLEQKIALRDELWIDGQLHLPQGWLRTVCLDLPAPAGVEVSKHLAKTFVEGTCSSKGSDIYLPRDFSLLDEIRNLIFAASGSFSDEQISALLATFDSHLRGLSEHLSGELDFMGLQSSAQKEMYYIAHILWLLTGSSVWTASDSDTLHMQSILDIYEKAGLRHCGLYCSWEKRLGREVDLSEELALCFRSGNETCARWGFEPLAIGILHPEMELMEISVIESSIDILAQQIVWGVPR